MAHPTLPGVVNLGNTCFLGSTLQALAATHPFPDVLVRPDSTAVSHHPVLGYLPGPSCSPDPPPSGLPITSALSHVLAKLAKDESTAAKPAQLLKELSKKREEYADYDQQDAHELLRVLVDGVRMEEVDLMKGWEQKEKERKEASPRGRRKRMSSATGTLRPHITVSRPSFTSSTFSSDPGSDADDDDDVAAYLSPSSADSDTSSSDDDVPGSKRAANPQPWRTVVDLLFSGTLTQFVVCSECKHVSLTTEDFLDLSLSLPRPPSSTHQVESNEKAPRSASSDRMREKLKKALFPHGGASSGSNTEKEGKRLKKKQYRQSLTVSATESSEASTGEDSGLSRRRSFDSSAGAKSRRGLWGRDLSPSREKGSVSASEASGGAGLSRRSSVWRKKDPSPVAGTPPSPPHVHPHQSEEDKAYVHRILAEVPAGSTYISPNNHHHNRSGAPNGGVQALRFAQPSPASRTHAPGGASPENDLGPGPGPSGVVTDGSPPAGSDTALYALLRRFTSVETLDGDNLFACKNCWKLLHPEETARRKERRAAALARRQRRLDETRRNRMRSSTLVPTSTRMSTTKDVPLAARIEEEDGLGGELSHVNSLEGMTPMAVNYSPFTMGPPDTSAATRPSLKLTTPSGISGAPQDGPLSAISEASSREMRRAGTPSSGIEADSEGESGSATDGSAVEEDKPRESSGESVGNVAQRLAAIAPLGAKTEATAVASSVESLEPKRAPPLHRDPKPPHYVLRAAQKRYLLSSLPPVLVIQFKRFEQTFAKPSRLKRGLGIPTSFSDFKKIDDFISFPQKLDIGAFLAPPPRNQAGSAVEHADASARHGVKPWLDHLFHHHPHRHHRRDEHRRRDENDDPTKCRPVAEYSLYATVNHIGTLGAGHYIAYVLSDRWKDAVAPGKTDGPHERRWMYVSDTVVRFASLDEVLKSKAYLLFFERT